MITQTFQLFQLLSYLLIFPTDSLFLKNKIIMIDLATAGIATIISFTDQKCWLGKKCWNVFGCFHWSFVFLFSSSTPTHDVINNNKNNKQML